MLRALLTSSVTIADRSTKTMTLEILPVPCLQDNYAWIAHDPATDSTAVIDVPDAAAVSRALAARGWHASHILITHHHADHTAGVETLAGASGARVIGAAADAHRLPPLDEAVGPGDKILIGMDTGEVIDVAGHTRGHIAFHFPQSGLAFTGDSLMSCGCGRLFEGTAEEMWESLLRLLALKETTLICSGHEYTQSNIRFALSVDPDNPALLDRAARVDALRAAGKPTLPTRLSEEIATNPFLRAADPDFRKALGMADATPAEVFAHLRAAKDRF